MHFWRCLVSTDLFVPEIIVVKESLLFPLLSLLDLRFVLGFELPVEAGGFCLAVPAVPLPLPDCCLVLGFAVGDCFVDCPF